MRCSRYEQGCRATGSMALVPENAHIVLYQLHNHRPGHDIELGQFLQNLRDRAVVEGVSARAIYEESARR